MTFQEQVISELSEITGTQITLEGDDSCTVSVSGVTIALRYRPVSEDWLMFATLFDHSGDGLLPRAKLAALLSASFLGAKTNGFQPGLFAEALLLSGTLPAQPPSAQALAEKMVRLAETVNALGPEIEQAQDAVEEECVEGGADRPFEMFRV